MFCHARVEKHLWDNIGEGVTAVVNIGWVVWIALSVE